MQAYSIQCLNNQIFQLQQSQINDWEELFNRLTIFIMDCNGEQIRYAAQSFAELCHLFAEQLIKVVLTKKYLQKFVTKFIFEMKFKGF